MKDLTVLLVGFKKTLEHMLEFLSRLMSSLLLLLLLLLLLPMMILTVRTML